MKIMGELWGGIAAASIILPQAMAFGAALWGVFGGDPAAGAMAGLVAASAFSLAAGAAGGTRGMVSSPTGPTLVLLSGTAAALHGQGLAADAVISALMVVLFLTGVLQAVMGLLGSGQLIKFIPYPVIAGFMTGSAILMVVSQIGAATGTSVSHLENLRALPLVTAAVTFAAIVFGPRWVPKVPGTVAGLVVGTIAYYLFALFLPSNASGDVVGSLPGLGALRLSWPDWSGNLPWVLLISASLALAVLASLDSLLTSVVADTATGERHNARRELVRQGVAHVLSGLFGGMSGAGTTGATVVAIRSGGGRWVGPAVAVVMIAILVVAAPLAAYLPLSVLAGIILHVAIVSMIDRSLVAWVRHRRTRLDATIALTVTGVTVFYDLMVAVGVGVAIAIIQFVRDQVQAPVVHARITADQRPSLRRRTKPERDLLAANGARVVLYQLRGNLFFGTVDRLYEILNPDLQRQCWLVFDLSRVEQVDLTAKRMLQQLAERVRGNGGELIFANVRKVRGLKREVETSLQRIAGSAPRTPVLTFIDTDEAVEFAENALLESLGAPPAPPEASVNAEEIELFANLPSEARSKVLAVVRNEQVAKGETLFKAGDEGDALYVVLSGQVDALLPYGKHHYRRVGSFGPGTFFGEVVFVQPGPRTADARAAADSELLVLDREAMAHLTQENPQAAVALLRVLGGALAEHLRWADHELRRLSS